MAGNEHGAVVAALEHAGTAVEMQAAAMIQSAMAAIAVVLQDRLDFLRVKGFGVRRWIGLRNDGSARRGTGQGGEADDTQGYGGDSQRPWQRLQDMGLGGHSVRVSVRIEAAFFSLYRERMTKTLSDVEFAGVMSVSYGICERTIAGTIFC